MFHVIKSSSCTILTIGTVLEQSSDKTEAADTAHVLDASIHPEASNDKLDVDAKKLVTTQRRNTNPNTKL